MNATITLPISEWMQIQTNTCRLDNFDTVSQRIQDAITSVEGTDETRVAVTGKVKGWRAVCDLVGGIIASDIEAQLCMEVE